MKYVLLAFMALLAGFSHAQSSGVNYPITTLRNISTLGPIVVSPANVQSFALMHTLGGVVESTAATKMPLGTGGHLPITVTSAAKKSDVASALGRFAKKSLPLLSTGFALYDLARELDYTLRDKSGELEITKSEIRLGGGVQFSIPPFTGPTPQAVCSAWAAANTPAGTVGTSQTMVSNGTSFCRMLLTFPGNPVPNEGSWFGIDEIPFETSEEIERPATLQELEDAIAQKSGWPTSSTLSQATKDAIKAGEQIEFTPQSITGPSSTPGTSTTTNNGTETITTTTTNNYTYNGPNVSISTRTVVTTVDNQTGLPTKPDQITETEPEIVNPDQSLLCKVFPEIVACAKLGEPEEVEIPRIQKDVTYEVETPFGGGTCPADKTFSFQGRTLKLTNMNQACNFLATFAKPIAILLASFSALMIVAVGVKE